MWGKVLGTLFGFMFGRWLGAILGFYLGHMFDRSLKQDFERAGGFQGMFGGSDVSERQALFFSSCFAVMGHIAKSNGRVNEIHIKAASAFMDEMGLSASEKREAQDAFRAGKAEDFSLRQTLRDFRERFAGRFDLLQLFLEIQIQMAFCDGHLASQERALLQQVSKQLGISRPQFEFMLKRFQAEFNFRRQRFEEQNRHQGTGRSAPSSNGMGRQRALEVLGLGADADAKAIKRAYRKLMAQHHPDKLVSQGLPEHMMQVAKQKSQDIQAAYEYLKKSA